MMDLSEIREKLKVYNLKKLSKELKIHFNTMYSIYNGKVSPSYKVLKKLSDYFEKDSAYHAVPLEGMKNG